MIFSKNLTKFICILLLLFTTFNVGYSQKHNLKIVTFDDSTSEPIKFANITFETKIKSVNKLTDSIGIINYTFNANDTLSIKITHINYYTEELKNIILLNDTLIRIELKKKTKTKEVVTVIGKQIYSNNYDKFVYNTQLDSTLINKNAINAINNLPFFSYNNNDGIKYKIDKKILVLLNGKRFGIFTNDPQAALESLPAKYIKQIEVIYELDGYSKQQGYDVIVNIKTIGYLVGELLNSNSNTILFNENIANNTSIYFFTQRTNNGFELKANVGTSPDFKNSNEQSTNQIGESYRAINLQNNTKKLFNIQATFNKTLNIYNTINFYTNATNILFDRINSYNRISSNFINQRLINLQNTTKQLYNGIDYTYEKKSKLNILYKSNISNEVTFNKINNKILNVIQQNLALNTKSIENAASIIYLPIIKKAANILELGYTIYKRNNKLSYFNEDFTQQPQTLDYKLLKNRQNIHFFYINKRFKNKKYSLTLNPSFNIATYKNFENNIKLVDTVQIAFLPNINFRRKLNKFSNLKWEIRSDVKRPDFFNNVNINVNFDGLNNQTGSNLITQRVQYKNAISIDKFNKKNKNSYYLTITNSFIPSFFGEYFTYNSVDSIWTKNVLNYGKINSIGFELGYSLKLKKGLTINTNSNIFIDYYKDKISNRNIKGNGGQLTFNATKNLKSSNISTNLFYYFTTNTLQGKEKMPMRYSIFYSLKLFNKLIDFNFGLENIFDKQRLKTEKFTINNLTRDVETRTIGRSFIFSLAYKFSSIKVGGPAQVNKINSNDILDKK